MSETYSTAFGEDQFNRQPFGQKLERYLMVEHDFVPGSLVVSLNAPFGAGKTTFLSMWADDLGGRRSAGASVPIVLMLNAWEGDYGGDPLLAIISGLIHGLERHSLKDKPEAEKRLREAAKDMAWFTVGLANDLVSKWSGIDAIGAGEFAKTKKKERKPDRPDFLKLYEDRIASLQNLKSQLKIIFESKAPTAVVIVDELDRCRPDYAIHYLETIKHVFDIHGIVFVVGVDWDQMGCSARKLFGHDLNSEEYFRKFFHRSFALPEIDEAGTDRIIRAYIKKYMFPDGGRGSLMNAKAVRDHALGLIKGLKMTPRQIQELFRLLGHVAGDTSNQGGELAWTYVANTVFLAALKVSRNSLYHRVGKGFANVLEVGRLMIDLGLEDPNWWFSVYVTSRFSRQNETWPEIISAWNELGFPTGGEAIGPNPSFPGV